MEYPNLHFYAAERADTSIIAYADTMLKKRHYKITYLGPQDGYNAAVLRCGKYISLGSKETLERIKDICNKHRNNTLHKP